MSLNPSVIKIYVAGHRGMVGSAIVRQLQAVIASEARQSMQLPVIASEARQSMPPDPLDCHVATAPRNDKLTVIASEARQSMQLSVIASEARQSMNPDPLDCHVANAPRNDKLTVIASEARQSMTSEPVDCHVATAPRNDGANAVIASEARQSTNPDPVDCHVAGAPRNDKLTVIASEARQSMSPAIIIITRTHAELDLTDQSAVQEFFKQEKPDQVYLAAAKVGGIHANNTYPADFIYQNLMVQANVIEAAFQNGVKKLLFLGSSCIYPRLAPQPMREDALLTGPLEPTNEPYAIAKIAGIKLCESYNRQHGVDYRSVMPTNLYGPGDNYHPQNSHVIPALIRRFHEAKVANAPSVAIWGSGTPKREFLYVDDMAAASVFVMNLPKAVYDQHTSPMLSHINVGFGVDISIAELAQAVSDTVGYPGHITFDPTQPDGAPRKLMDSTRLNALGWQAQVKLEQGLALAYQDFLDCHVATAPRNDGASAVIASEARQSMPADPVDCHVATAPRNDKLTVIASEARQSMSPDPVDCHVATAPRNDGAKAVIANEMAVIASEARQSMNPDSSLRAKRGNP